MNKTLIKEYSTSILKYKKYRYFKGIMTIVLSLITIYLLSFFYYGINDNIDSQVFNRGDSLRFSLSKNLTPNSNSSLSIVKTIPPSTQEALGLKKYVSSLKVGYDITYFFPEQVSLLIDGKREDIAFIGIEKITDDLLINGRNITNSDNEVIVNQVFLNKYGEHLDSIDISIHKPFTNVVGETYLEDTFIYQKRLNVVGIIDEYDFMNTPTIYYRYQNMIEYLKNNYLQHYSLYLTQVYTWYDFLTTADSSSGIRGYSLFLFVNSVNDAKKLIALFNNLASDLYLLESNTLNIYEVLNDLSFITKSLLTIVILLCSLVLVVVLAYLIYVSLMQDQTQIGILSALGCDHKNIIYAYIYLSYFMMKKGILYSLPLAIGGALIGNLYFDKYLGLGNIFALDILPNILIVIVLSLITILTIVTFLVTRTIINKEVNTLLKEE